MFLLFTKSFQRTLTHHKQQSVHKHFSCVLKNIWRIINIKEGSCNIIYKINLTGMSILFPNKGMGRQRQPIGLSSIIYWAKKNQNCRQPKLDSSSGQIYWVISHHQYISRSRYAGEGENYRLKGTARCWRLAQQMLISWTKQQHHWFKKDKWKRKKDANLVVCGSQSPRGAHDGQIYF